MFEMQEALMRIGEDLRQKLRSEVDENPIMEDHIRNGIEKGVLVYDGDSGGNLTRRLIYRIWRWGTDRRDPVGLIYCPTDSFPEFDNLDRQYGIKLIFDPDLNENGKLTDFYLGEGASLPNKHTSLLLGIMGSGNCILGSC